MAAAIACFLAGKVRECKAKVINAALADQYPVLLKTRFRMPLTIANFLNLKKN